MAAPIDALRLLQRVNPNNNEALLNPQDPTSKQLATLYELGRYLLSHPKHLWSWKFRILGVNLSSMNARYEFPKVPLEKAVKMGDRNLVLNILETTPPEECLWEQSVCSAAFYYSAKNGHLDVLKLLMKYNQTDLCREQALQGAEQGGHQEAVKHLFKTNPTPERKK